MGTAVAVFGRAAAATAAEAMPGINRGASVPYRKPPTTKEKAKRKLGQRIQKERQIKKIKRSKLERNMRQAAANEQPKKTPVLLRTEEEGGGLTEEQLGLLLQDENVQRAMAEIAADPEAIVRYQDDPVVMGVIHALNAQ